MYTRRLITVNVNVTKYVSKNVKNSKFVTIRCVLSSSKCTKTRFWSQPFDPAGGAYDVPPVGWGGTHSLPYPFPSRRLGSYTPPIKIPGLSMKKECAV